MKNISKEIAEKFISAAKELKKECGLYIDLHQGCFDFRSPAGVDVIGKGKNYVIEYDWYKGIFFLQENLESGEIRYIKETKTFQPLFRQIKKELFS